MTTSTGLTRKGQATRDRIVAAASQLMFERGVAGTSTEDVQQAAGVSASQIYHYFGDKRSLVAAVIAHQTELVVGPQEPMLLELDSVAALEGWADTIVAMQRARDCVGGCPIGSLASELAEQDPDARTGLATGFARWEAAIRAGLTNMQQRGELDAAADPSDLALALLTAVQGGLLMTQTRRDTTALEAVLAAVIATVRQHAVH